MEADFSEFFSEDGPGLGLENLPDQGRDEGEEPPSSDEESCASSEHHSDNKSVGYSVEEYERERGETWKREGNDDMSLFSDEPESEDKEGGALPELLYVEDAEDALEALQAATSRAVYKYHH